MSPSRAWSSGLVGLGAPPAIPTISTHSTEGKWPEAEPQNRPPLPPRAVLPLDASTVAPPCRQLLFDWRTLTNRVAFPGDERRQRRRRHAYLHPRRTRPEQ